MNNALLDQAKAGLSSLSVNPVFIESALASLQTWLSDDMFIDYVPQIEHLIEKGHWNYLLDSFYQVIPFGTGGRRGEVGVGPNRINPWTIKASAQGHSQYLIKKYGEAAKTRGIVFTYDVREFKGNQYFNDQLPNPVKDLTSRSLSIVAARTYAANGIKIYLFDDVRTTPELSFAIRHLHTVSGAMFSASHNPPTHNGKKVYDEFGGQLVPPDDEELVNEVTQRVSEIKDMDYDQAVKAGLIQQIGAEVDDAYIAAASQVSLSAARELKIVFTPLHGCGGSSVFKALKTLGFDIQTDPRTSNPSGQFENVTFNIANPEVIQSFDTTLEFAKAQNADIILSTDPDADRIGTMVKHKGEWVFVNGNDIAVILAEYAVQKRKPTLNGNGVIVKTTVTTNLLTKICEANGIQMIGDHLIGFKYISDSMNQLEKQGNIDGFIFGCEESHGYLAGNYCRDKDAITPAIWLAELAAELKPEGKTLIDFLDETYTRYGYFRNYLTEIRMLGASGKEKIDKIQSSLRANPPTHFGNFEIIGFEDCRKRLPILSGTDNAAKDVLIFRLKPVGFADSIKVTVRPSGTEPKSKMYFEIGTKPVPMSQLEELKTEVESMLRELEKTVMRSCYALIGIDFPDRGFLLFWQLPLEDKMKYFEIEPQIEALKTVTDSGERKAKLNEMLAFLGSNAVQKMDAAFQAKHSIAVNRYLELE